MLSRGMVVAACLFAGVLASAARGATLIDLGSLPGGGYDTWARAVSADGRVVVGSSAGTRDGGGFTNAFRWTEAEGMQDLGPLPPNALRAWATAVSADGSVIAGWITRSTGSDVFRWTESTGVEVLGSIGDASSAQDISADGSSVVGVGGSSFFYWRASEGLVVPPDKPGNNAMAISADGSVIIGESWWWKTDGTSGTIDGIPGGGEGTRAYAISADGSMVVGKSEGPSGQEAFRWTFDGTIEGLGDLPGGDFHSVAYDASADGSIIVGKGEVGPFGSTTGNRAFIWTETDGMRLLSDVLEVDYGLDLTGWTLYKAFGVSDDGHVVTGHGLNPDGLGAGWRAELVNPVPLPSAAWAGLALFGLIIIRQLWAHRWSALRPLRGARTAQRRLVSRPCKCDG